MTFNEIYSNIESQFQAYKSVGLLDKMAMYDEYKFRLKQFGALPLEKFSEVIKIKGGRGQLPEGFRKLLYAVKCEPFFFETAHKDHLQSARFWRERHEETHEWDSGCPDDRCVKGEKYIVETLYYRDYDIKYRYKNPIPLRLTEGFNKSSCDGACKNFKVKSSPFEINIIGSNVLQANFQDGNIYIEYRGFGTDEDGFITVPETFNGYLERYLISSLKTFVLQSVLTNGDATQAEQTLFGLSRADEEKYFRLAMTELKAKGFSTEARRNYKNKLRTEYSKIEFITP